MMNLFKNAFAKSYEDLSGPDFRKLYESTQNAVLLDVRTADEFASGTIKGAKNIDFLSVGFSEKIGHLDKSNTYFLFCRSGNRSGKACDAMASKGFKVYNLAGGIGAWNSK